MAAKAAYTTIEEYILQCSQDAQPRLRQMWAVIRRAAPQAGEKISWGMATFTLNGNLVHFSGERKHMGFHPAPSAIAAFADELKEYRCSKGTVQLPYDRPLPEELIERMVKFRVAEQLAPKPKQPVQPRARIEMPEDCREALAREGLQAHYDARPPYQRNDYIGWINRAKRAETRQKRLGQMLDELRAGDAYMGMAYNAKMPNGKDE